MAISCPDAGSHRLISAEDTARVSVATANGHHPPMEVLRGRLAAQIFRRARRAGQTQAVLAGRRATDALFCPMTNGTCPLSEA